MVRTSFFIRNALFISGFLIFFVNAFFWEKVSSLDFLICVGVLCIGFFTGLLLDRIFTPCIEKIRRLFTKSAGTQRDSKTDIRDVQNSLESVLKYDPQTFSILKNGFWFG
ncbi:hypothetical protein DKC15_019120 (plasmid) [Acinetobacter pittii]|nr:hypothetical protein DKC15_019120 [Acinetobacter pittii]